jgi:hypothetical protein
LAKRDKLGISFSCREEHDALAKRGKFCLIPIRCKLISENIINKNFVEIVSGLFLVAATTVLIGNSKLDSKSCYHVRLNRRHSIRRDTIS